MTSREPLLDPFAAATPVRPPGYLASALRRGSRRAMRRTGRLVDRVIIGALDSMAPPPSPGEVPRVMVRGLTGAHIGIALSMWRAEVLGDVEMRTFVAEHEDLAAVFGSGLDLLLAQLHLAAEVRASALDDSGECDLGVEFARTLIARDDLAHARGFLLDVTDAIDAGHHTSMRVRPLSVFDLLDLNVLIGEITEDDVDIDEQWEALEEMTHRAQRRF